jgi:hypothetical protein
MPIPAAVAENDDAEEIPSPAAVPMPAPIPAPIAADAGMLNARIVTTSIDSTANFFIVLIQSPLLDIDKVKETIINILLFIITKSNRFRIYYNSYTTKYAEMSCIAKAARQCSVLMARNTQGTLKIRKRREDKPPARPDLLVEDSEKSLRGLPSSPRRDF